MTKRVVLLVLLMLLSTAVNATDEKYLQCFKSFPNSVKLKLGDQLYEKLQSKSVSDYEKKYPNMGGYAIHYQKIGIPTEQGDADNLCESSLFIYSGSPSDKNKFTFKAMNDHLVQYTLGIQKSKKRLSAQSFNSKKSDIMSPNLPEGSELMTLVGKTNIRNHEVYVTDSFFDEESERVMLTNYKGNYLKLLLTCSNLDKDIDVNKTHLNILSDTIMKMSIDYLNNCQQ